MKLREDYVPDADQYICECVQRHYNEELQTWDEATATWRLDPMPEFKDDSGADPRWICNDCYEALPSARVAAYLKDGICCPACGVADEIAGDSIEISGNEAVQCQECCECRSTWVAIYKLDRCASLDSELKR